MNLGALWAYQAIQTQLSWWAPLPNTVANWCLCFIAVDFCYYWYHRLSHESNGLWIFHQVHHQSNHYNLSVALRQTWFGGPVSFAFYLPLALLGIPLAMMLYCKGLNLIYQFFIHSPYVPKLGPLEWLLNTPSHHRVHHGADKKYLDCNYGGGIHCLGPVVSKF